MICNYVGLVVVERLLRGRRSRLVVLRIVVSEVLCWDMRLRLCGLRRLWYGIVNVEVVEVWYEYVIGIEWLFFVVWYVIRYSSSIVRIILDFV